MIINFIFTVNGYVLNDHKLTDFNAHQIMFLIIKYCKRHVCTKTI